MEKPSFKFPECPGVYLFKNKETPIYIGKAINLKARLKSYFSERLLPKTQRMVSEATALEVIKVNSELEALLLEAKLIRKFQPKYNSQAKDDKHPLYIVITKDEFPRVIAVRKLMANGESVMANFGPFPSSNNVRFVLKTLRKIFPYSDHKIGKRPCLYSQIGLCSPCPNTILKIKNKKLKTQMKNIYKRNITNIKAVLSGKIKLAQTRLKKEMEILANELKYEAAAEIREKIKSLEYITQPKIPSESFLENPNLYEDLRNKELENLKTVLASYKLKLKSLHRIEGYDVSHLAGTRPTASMVVFTDGEPDKSQYRHFRIKQKKPQSDFDSIIEVARRRAKNPWPRPDLIIVDGGVAQVKAFSAEAPVVGIAKNPDRLIIGNKKIRLTGPALNLVQRLRDEAHRFARRYHKKLLWRSLISTEKGLPV